MLKLVKSLEAFIKSHYTISEITTWNINAAFPYFLRFWPQIIWSFHKMNILISNIFNFLKKNMYFLSLYSIASGAIRSHFLLLEKVSCQFPWKLLKCKSWILNINSTHKFKRRKFYKKILYTLWGDVPYQKISTSESPVLTVFWWFQGNRS